MTPFGDIMKRVVTATPHAIGGAFAASDGEMVDAYALGDAFEWAILTAHFGVLVAQLESAFGTLHYGGLDAFVARYDRADVLVCTVAAGYYAILAMKRDPAWPEAEPIADALAELSTAVVQLRSEMQ